MEPSTTADDFELAGDALALFHERAAGLMALDDSVIRKRFRKFKRTRLYEFPIDDASVIWINAAPSSTRTKHEAVSRMDCEEILMAVFAMLEGRILFGVCLFVNSGEA